jgi:protein TonB
MAIVGFAQGVVATLIYLASIVSIALPEHPDAIETLLYYPPPPPPPPLPKGSSLRSRPEAAKPVVEHLERPIEAPTQGPEPRESADIAKESGVRAEDLFGSVAGSDRGDAAGMEVGVDGGMVGGSPSGQPGGIPGESGTGPVPDYDSAPRILRQTRPRYPEEAFAKRIQGTVLLEILINSSGQVARTRVLESVPMLDAAARETVRQWLFQPAVKHGISVAAIAHAPVRFMIY